VLDSFATSPAIVKTPTWDVVAWNAAAMAVLGDYPGASAEERNVLRRLFADPAMKAKLPHWEDDARFALSVFRVEVARAGAGSEAVALAAELQASSADFRRLWAENEIRSHWVGLKQLQHPLVGSFTLETLAFAVDGADGLSMVVFTPATAADVRAVEVLIANKASQGSDR
jgi:hypothetical protein